VVNPFIRNTDYNNGPEIYEAMYKLAISGTIQFYNQFLNFPTAASTYFNTECMKYNVISRDNLFLLYSNKAVKMYRSSLTVFHAIQLCVERT